MAGRSPAFQAAWDKSLTLAAQPTNDEKLDVCVPSPSLPPLPLVPSHPTAKLTRSVCALDVRLRQDCGQEALQRGAEARRVRHLGT